MTATLDDLIKALAAKAVGGGAQPEKKGSILVTADTTQDVYDQKMAFIAASMKLDPLDPRVREEAAKQTKTQVGDLNFANWQKEKAQDQAELAEASRQKAQREAEEEAAAVPKIGDPYDSAIKVVEKYTAEATAMGQKMRRQSWEARKLDSGQGLSGTVTRVTAGTLGTAAATAHALDTATSEPVGLVTDAVAGGGIKKEGQKLAGEAKAVNREVGTSMDILTGDMQKLYDQVKPAIADFDDAFKHFDEAHSAFTSCGDMPDKKDWVTPMKTMESALDTMREASKRFDALGTGLAAKEADMDAYNQETAEGAAGHAMSFASNFLAPEKVGTEAALAKEAEGAVEKEAFKDVEKATAQEFAKDGKKLAQNVVKEDMPEGIAGNLKEMPKEQVKKAPMEATKSAANKAHDDYVEEQKKKAPSNP